MPLRRYKSVQRLAKEEAYYDSRIKSLIACPNCSETFQGASAEKRYREHWNQTHGAAVRAMIAQRRSVLGAKEPK